MQGSMLGKGTLHLHVVPEFLPRQGVVSDLASGICCLCVHSIIREKYAMPCCAELSCARYAAPLLRHTHKFLQVQLLGFSGQEALLPGSKLCKMH